MSINVGDQAPAFELACKPGETVNVGDHLGTDPVVILFMPFAFSPVCTDEMCHFRDQWSAWNELDAKVFGVTVDSPFTTAKFRESENIPFPILSDFNKDVAATYGALHDDLKGMKGVAKRAAFVADREGKVKYAWVSDNPGTQVDFDAIKEAVAGCT